MRLEETSCPCCGSDKQSQRFFCRDYRFQVSDANFFVVKCCSCGFLFLNPRPAKEEILRCYPAGFNKQDKTILFRIIAPLFSKAQDITISIFKKYKKSGKVLDIGCGNGDFLLSMKKQGYDVWGIEQNPEASHFCSPALKNKIFYKEVEKCNFASGSFDIITSFQSLEHVYDLNILLSEVHRILKDDGIFYACVPNMDFFEARLFGPYYYNLEVPRHLYFFSQKNLSNLLLKNSFKIDRFFKDSIFETVSTPASFYHGFWNFILDRGIFIPDLVKSLTFFPLVAFRFILRLFFIFDNQNLKVLCLKA